MFYICYALHLSILHNFKVFDILGFELGTCGSTAYLPNHYATEPTVSLATNNLFYYLVSTLGVVSTPGWFFECHFLILIDILTIFGYFS
jgi:hypothetical protein